MSAPRGQGLLATPRAKLLLACALVSLLALVAPRGGPSIVGAARGLLALALLGGGGWWLSRARSAAPTFRLAEPLQVLSRKGLSARCSVALVQAGGQRFLVAYGDSFAQVRAMPLRRRRRARAAAGRRSSLAAGVLQ